MSLQDRDFLISKFQPNWKDMFCFTQPMYTKEAYDLVSKGFQGVIRKNKDIIYTEYPEITKENIENSIIIDENDGVMLENS